MDGFEVRLQLVSILRKLSSSQNSIQTTIRFLQKHRSKCGEDLWDCLVEECENVSTFKTLTFLVWVFYVDYLREPEKLSSNAIGNQLTEDTL